MKTAPIQFTNNQQSGLDALAGGSPIAMNVMRDSLGAVRRRPGLTTADGVTDGVIDEDGIVGLYKTHGRLWAFSGSAPQKVYRVNATSSLFETAYTTSTGSRPVFAETDAQLVWTAGGSPRRILHSTGAVEFVDGSPPKATHVIANAARLLMNSITDPSRAYYSNVQLGELTTGHDEWSGDGTGVFTGEARPDPVVALGENTSEVFLFGTQTLQVFSPDGSYIYVPSSVREYGCLAAYSIIRRDNQFAWLDHQRRFVVSDGRSVEVISTPIQRTLDSIETVDDCIGYRVRLGSHDCLVWSFLADGRAFVFQEGLWSQWSGWNGQHYTALPVSAFFQDGNVPLVGLTDGRIGRFSLDAGTDFGEAMRCYVETGYENRGTDALKACSSVHLSLQRGTSSSSTAPIAWLGYRDRPGPWTRLPVTLGVSGETEIVVPLYSLGVYRRRQWSFEFSGTDDIALVGATEEYEVL